MSEGIVIKLEDNNRNVRKRGRPPKVHKKLRSVSYEYFQNIHEKQLKHKRVKTCRVCLNKGNIPIYGDESIEDLSESFMSYGGVEIEQNDSLPKYLCHACHEQLQSAIMFRKTAMETDKYLRETVSKVVDCEVAVKQEYLDRDLEEAIFKDTLADEHTRYHCELCNEDFENSLDYGTHMLTEKHSRVKGKCPFCNRKFNYIQKHLAHHREYKTVKCEICNVKYLESLINRHKETHFTTPTFKCNECPYRTRYAGDYKVHLRKHTGERPYQCQHCSAKFINKSNLNRHEFTHSDTSQLPFPCNKCERGFYNERELNMHTAVDHQGAREHLCNICGKAFGYRKSMMKHQLQVHKREKLLSGRKRVFYLQLQDEQSDDIDAAVNKKIKDEGDGMDTESN